MGDVPESQLNGTRPGPAPAPGGTRPRCPCAAALARGKKVCWRTSAPSARASALGPGSAVRSAAALGPPSLRGFGCACGAPLRRVGSRPGLLPRPIGACASPPLRRRPRPPAASLRAVLRPGPARPPATRPGRCGRPCLLRVGLRPALRCLRAPCVPLGGARRRGPPGAVPPASCPPSSLGRLAAWPGFGLRGSRPGLRRGFAPLLRPSGPGVGGSAACGRRGTGVRGWPAGRFGAQPGAARLLARR